MTGVSLNQFPAEFAAKLQQTISREEWERLHICPSGLAVIKAEQGSAYYPVGCPTCLTDNRGQNEQGAPTLNGKPMVLLEDLGAPKHIEAPEFWANAWTCPDCKLVRAEYLPVFDSNGAL